MKNSILVCVGSILVASVAQAEPIQNVSFRNDTRVHSAQGPGSGETAVAVGLRGIGGVTDDGSAFFPLPFVDVDVVHGITDSFNYDFHLSTSFLISELDTGLRYSFGNDNISVSVGGTLNAVIVAPFLVDGDSLGALLGGGPTAQMSVGGSAVQFTLGMDAIFYGAAAVVGGSSNGFSFADDGAVVFGIKPWAALEFDVSPSVGMYIKAESALWGAANGDGQGGIAAVVPMGAVGVVF